MSKTDPEHYQCGDPAYEAIRVLEAWGMGRDFCRGNAIKYLVRMGRKEGESALDDLRKCRWLIDRLIAQEEEVI